MTKNERIKQTLQETRQKRLGQRCFVREFKINTRKMRKSDLKQMYYFFTQAKWLYNYLLSLEDIYSFDKKTRDIYSLDKDKNKVERHLTLPAKIIEAIYDITKDNIKGLSATKKKGKKVGKLKFKSEYTSIPLKQYSIYHEFKENNLFRICGFRKYFKLNGLSQLENTNYEFANAKLIKKASGFYIHLTCFENLSKNPKNNPDRKVGLDFGIKIHITTSDNEKFNISVGESERLKGLQKKLARQQKGSKSRYRTLTKINREYERIVNLKVDKANKLVNYFRTNYSFLSLQDEMIKSWHKGKYGKQVQHSCLGKLKAKLKSQTEIEVVLIDKSLPTTKMCYQCGNLHEMPVDVRQFVCPNCGLSEERDLKAAKTILLMGQCKSTHFATERSNPNVEKMSDFILAYEKSQPKSKRSFMKHRSPCL